MSTADVSTETAAEVPVTVAATHQTAETRFGGRDDQPALR